MSKIRLHGTSSGYTEIVPKAAAASNTLTAPSTVGELIAKDAAGAIGITSVQSTNANFSGTARITTGIVTSFSGDVTLPTGSLVVNADNTDAIKLGASADLLLYHDGSNSKIKNVNTGRLHIENAAGVIRTNTDSGFYIQSADGNTEHARVDSSGANISGITTCTEINTTQTQLANRNVIINGDMMISQRGTAWADVGNSAQTYTIDRWETYVQNSAARFTISQDSESPDGFGKSIKIDCTTADTSLAATDEVQFFQKVEGFNCARFNKGTSSALQYTLSFWAKTNKTGTYIVRLLGRDNTNRCVSASYTVSDTNWNRYVLTFPADTTAKDNCDNGEALRVVFWLVAGSGVNSGTLQTTWVNSTDTGAATGQVNFADSTSNVLYLTGVQLEAGSVATPYEHQNYGESFSRCARYYQEQQGHSDLFMFAGKAQGSTSVDGGFTLNVPMRAEPTLTCGEHRAFKSLSASQTNSSNAPTVTSWDASHSVHSATLGVNLSGHSGFSNNEVVNWCPKSALFTVDSEL